MALTADQQAALANEARLRELTVEEARLRGQIDAQSRLIALLSSDNSDTNRVYLAKRQEREAFQSGIGSGLGDEYGSYSTIEQAMRSERFAGKSAAINYIKANPACLQDDAVTAYTNAALAARPADQQWLLQSGAGLLKQYAANAVQAGHISDSTWETFRAFIVATDKDSLMGM